MKILIIKKINITKFNKIHFFINSLFKEFSILTIDYFTYF